MRCVSGARITRTAKLRSWAASVAISALLLLTGCATEIPITGGQDGIGQSNDGPGETTGQNVADDDSGRDPQERNEAETSAADDSAADFAGTGSECLIGTWQMRTETFEASLAQLMGTGTISLSGDSYIRFDVEGNYRSWLDEFTMEISADGRTVRHIQNSGEAAQYDADAEYVWVSGFVEVFFEAVMDVGGFATVELDASDTARVSVFDYRGDVPGVNREMIDGAARYQCDGSNLELYADGGLAAAFIRAPSSTQPKW